ncbi:hypothetical protein [Parabacteroides distasonis]|uniref:hypothetical protein n=1 Tax=Parabacteroides distasonis TaxID=823 RepID=UPI00321B1912
MKAERQQKDLQQAEPIQSKREKPKLIFEDNREYFSKQSRIIDSIQRSTIQRAPQIDTVHANFFSRHVIEAPLTLSKAIERHSVRSGEHTNTAIEQQGDRNSFIQDIKNHSTYQREKRRFISDNQFKVIVTVHDGQQYRRLYGGNRHIYFTINILNEVDHCDGTD